MIIIILNDFVSIKYNCQLSNISCSMCLLVHTLQSKNYGNPRDLMPFKDCLDFSNALTKAVFFYLSNLFTVIEQV
jgi:hypothetical protein